MKIPEVGGVEERKEIKIRLSKDKNARVVSGKRTRTLATHGGKYVSSKIPEAKARDIAVDATIRAAIARTCEAKVEKQDLREKVRAKKASSVIVFVVDASGSAAALQGLEMARGTVLGLLEDSYQKRDKVGLVVVSGNKAQVLLMPTTSVQLAARCFGEINAEGFTPLSDGIYKGFKLLRTEMWKSKNVIPIMVLVSDGAGNVPMGEPGSDVRSELLSISKDIKKHGMHLVVIDTSKGIYAGGPNYNKEIAKESGGVYYDMEELDSKKLIDVLGFGNTAMTKEEVGNAPKGRHFSLIPQPHLDSIFPEPHPTK